MAPASVHQTLKGHLLCVGRCAERGEQCSMVPSIQTRSGAHILGKTDAQTLVAQGNKQVAVTEVGEGYGELTHGRRNRLHACPAGRKGG